MVNKYIKKSSTSFVLREMQIKATVSVSIYSLEWTKLKSQIIAGVGKDMNNWILLYYWWEYTTMLEN